MAGDMQRRDDAAVPARRSPATASSSTPHASCRRSAVPTGTWRQRLHGLQGVGRGPALVVLDVDVDATDVQEQSLATLRRKEPCLENWIENEVLDDRPYQVARVQRAWAPLREPPRLLAVDRWPRNPQSAGGGAGEAIGAAASGQDASVAVSPGARVPRCP